MGRTLKGRKSADAPAPLEVTPAIVRVSQNWPTRARDWHYDPTIHFRSARYTTGAEGIGECELRRAYGAAVREPGQDAAARDPIDLAGWWVKIELALEKGETVIWVGRISSSTKKMHASPTEAAGWQTWTAHGMLQMLRKTHIHQSVWIGSAGGQQILDWVPNVNGRDANNMLVGNRSAETQGGYATQTYIYGGTDIWTHYQYLNYLLDRVVDKSNDKGPVWTIGGQVEILKNLRTTIPIKAIETVASLLAKLIPVRYGIDYKIVPFDTGFEIQVFALSGEGSGGGIVNPTKLPTGATRAGTSSAGSLPRNTPRITLKASEMPAAPSIRVVETLDHQYDRIRVIGRRMVTCCTLSWADGSLVQKWPPALEVQYINNGLVPWNETAEGLDAARKDERFRQVYQAFGAPNDWDWNGGKAAPSVDTEGVVAGTGADRQSAVRGILPWVPLLEGYGYTSIPPVNNNLAGYQAAFMPPTAWLKDEVTGRWLTADQAGIGVFANPSDWGLTLSVSPNHLIAGRLFNDVTLTNTPARYDWHDLHYTIAMETDQRLELRFDRTSGWSERGETLVIEDPTSELWYLAHNTVVGVNKNGTLQRTTGDQTLRNDADRLAMVMAGAISRYSMQRARAEIRLKGLWPYGGWVGQILEVIESETGGQYIGAPITAVAWEAGEGPGTPPTTVIRAGFAR